MNVHLLLQNSMPWITPFGAFWKLKLVRKLMESLKRALIKAWEEIPLETLRKVIDDFPKRLNVCIEAQGGYFE
uniref:Uncharacterized protein n=1 Tax=Acrobeloides nanus TaxID=290746 RepID=A0A914CLS3_9BILA